MSEIILITGGQRSGKSNYAKIIAEERSSNPFYLATARKWDKDFEDRINRHRNDRGENWKTIEEEKNISSVNIKGKTVLLDCITLWLTNIFHDNKYDIDLSLAQAKEEWKKLISQDNYTLVVVSNELGMTIHPENEASRKFMDLQGWVNQYIASLANKVYLMISGIPVKIKG